MKLSILYRGPLSSCNYACVYCPFAKHVETRAEHDADGRALERFLAWVRQRRDDSLSVFFTPWGEALIRRRYQQAIAELSNLAQIDKVAIQTNLSCRLDWLDDCDTSSLGLWATYHPTQISLERFVARCDELMRREVRFSVGVVGVREQMDAIAALRAALPPEVYVWINAYKRVPDYYTHAEIEQLSGVDPLFPINNRRHASFGHDCRCGSSVISVDGGGTVRRCHFVREPIGNIYDADWAACLAERPCPNQSCGCHIGYVHMPELRLYDVFGDGVLERIPIRE